MKLLAAVLAYFVVGVIWLVVLGFKQPSESNDPAWWPYMAAALALGWVTLFLAGKAREWRARQKMENDVATVLGRADGLNDARVFFQANLKNRGAILKAIEENDQTFWQSLPARLGVHELERVDFERGQGWLGACFRYDDAYTSTMMLEVGRLFVTVLPGLDASLRDDADDHA